MKERDLNTCCVACAHWLPGRSEGSNLGTCKRYPPTVMPNGPQALPAMLPNDWCGEFKGIAP
jgi:hypothetical protein